MRRDLLVGMTVGAGLSAAVWLGYAQFEVFERSPPTVPVFELGYMKPSPTFVPEVYAGVSDPLSKQPTQALLELAVSCGVEEYKLTDHDRGTVPSAYLHIDPQKLSDEAYNCLANRVRPPYLTLGKVELCSRIIGRPNAPPCPDVVY